MTGIFRRVQNQKTTVGYIDSVRFSPSVNYDEPGTSSATVLFDVDGRGYSVRASSSNSFSSFREDKRVRVCYNADRPEDCFVRNDIFSFLFIAVLAMAGFFVLIIGIIEIFRTLF
jgi:hypothetical protein